MEKMIIPTKSRKCGAKARTNNHLPCRNSAMVNGRCRFHGGKSTGAKTLKGKRRQAKANLKHGHYTNKAIQERKEFRQQLQELMTDLQEFGDLHHNYLP